MYICSILCVTKKPPNIFIAARIIATNPNILDNSKPASDDRLAAAIIAPTIITEEIAFVTDINGVCKDGVKVMGSKNILNNLALTASSLYAKNLFNFVNNLYDKEKKDIYINKEDEIISKTLIDKKQ